MITIYHNPRCGKSREGLTLVEASGKPFKIVKYLNDPLSEKELKILLQKLQYKPLQLVRQKEAIWKEKFKGKNLTNDQIIKAMIDHPKLIERPIVTNDNQAVVGRPPENILNIL